MNLAPVLTLLLATTPPAAADTARPRPAADSLAADTLRPREGARVARRGRAALAMGATVAGYLSSRGLPPRGGRFTLTEAGLVFRSDDGRLEDTYPLVGPLRTGEGRRWRASSVTLAYVDESGGRTSYVFRLDGGVFQTENPGALLEVVDRAVWLDRLASHGGQLDRPLVSPADPAAARAVADALVRGSYADTLYALFGRPEQPVGQVGERGRRAGRLGEYLARRDSLALDPARMTSHDQLRHTLAHELGHRWQARAPRQLAVLWREIPPIRDTRRYGHGSVTEHQAEAIAFAVHYLQVTAASVATAESVRLLEQYERMVPGTAAMARYFALQPIYAAHPLRELLIRGTR